MNLVNFRTYIGKIFPSFINNNTLECTKSTRYLQIMHIQVYLNATSKHIIDIFSLSSQGKAHTQRALQVQVLYLIIASYRVSFSVLV